MTGARGANNTSAGTGPATTTTENTAPAVEDGEHDGTCISDTVRPKSFDPTRQRQAICGSHSQTNKHRHSPNPIIRGRAGAKYIDHSADIARRPLHYRTTVHSKQARETLLPARSVQSNTPKKTAPFGCKKHRNQ